MKTIKIFNGIAIGIPLFFGLLGFIWNGAWGIAAISTLLTGLLQVVAGILYWNANQENVSIKVYLAGVALFLIFWFAFPSDLDSMIVIFPPALCIYLCWIIYSHKTDKHETE